MDFHFESNFPVIYGLLATESGAYIDKADMIRQVREWEAGFVPEAVAALFNNGSDRVTFEEFVRWIDTGTNAESMGISRWLLFPNPNVALVNKLDTPTFYQTLSGVTHLEEQEIVELEKRFWNLAGNSSANQIDVVIIKPLVSPPLPICLVPAFFAAFDENEDGHIDFKELACGVSAACRGPELERQKCKCKPEVSNPNNVSDCFFFQSVSKCSTKTRMASSTSQSWRRWRSV